MKALTISNILLLCFLLIPAESLAQNSNYSLEVSDTSIETGDTITVTWNTSGVDTTEDWIGLYKPGANPRYNTLDWEWVDGDDGSVTFRIDEPGTYEVRYYRNRTYDLMETSSTFTVRDDYYDDDYDGDGDYELTINDTTIETGERVTVSYNSSGVDTTEDWIGLYKPGANPRYNTLDWEWVDGDDGSVTFRIDEPGTYEVRYYRNRSYDLMATSQTFVVSDANSGGAGGVGGGNSDYDLTLNRTSIEVGERITLSWDVASNDTSRDWVGLYKPGANPRYETLQWERVDDETGSHTFRINEPGRYEFRYYLDNSYELAAVSETFTVRAPDGTGGTGGTDDDYSLATDQAVYNEGGTARVSWDAADGERTTLDWIGLYRPGSPDRNYMDWVYAGGDKGTKSFVLKDSGTYEFRYFTRNSYNKVATSRTITVSDTDSSNDDDIDDGQVGQCLLNTNNIANFPPQNGPIIAFGDSITAGVGASNNQDYVEELEKRLNIDIINEGISGDTTRSALNRLEDDVLDRNPAAVIVFLGGNDELRRLYEELSDTAAERDLRDELEEIAIDRFNYNWEDKPLISRAETFNNIQTIVERIQTTGATTILVGFDDLIFTRGIDEGYQRIADRTDSFFVPDIYNNVFGRPRYMSDLVHPNDRGYDVLANRIQPALSCIVSRG